MCSPLAVFGGNCSAGVPGDAVPAHTPPFTETFALTAQQGVPGDAVPWPEREVSSLPFSSPAAAGGTGKVPE